MAKPKNPWQRIITFFHAIGTARRRPRSWEQAIGYPMANLAEHVYRVQVISVYLALKAGVDPRETAFMALWHDVSEIHATDATPHQKPFIKIDEEKAVATTVAGTELETLVQAAYQSYKQRTCLVSHCVKDADILDTVIELMELKAAGHGYPQHPRVQEQIAFKRTRYYTQAAKQLHDAIVAKDAPSPWDWFLQGDSTFTDGSYGR